MADAALSKPEEAAEETITQIKKPRSRVALQTQAEVTPEPNQQIAERNEDVDEFTLTCTETETKYDETEVKDTKETKEQQQEQIVPEVNEETLTQVKKPRNRVGFQSQPEVEPERKPEHREEVEEASKTKEKHVPDANEETLSHVKKPRNRVGFQSQPEFEPERPERIREFTVKESRNTKYDDAIDTKSSLSAESRRTQSRPSRASYTKPGTTDYRHSATLPKGMTKYSVLLEPSTPTRSASLRYRRSGSYTYQPRNFNPRKVRDYDDDDSPPLNLDFDDQLVRPRRSSITCLKLDEIERQVMELDPFENQDMKKGLKSVKYHSKLAMDSHDQALRRSRRLDQKLLDSFYDKMDEMGDDITRRHTVSTQNFQKLSKAYNRAPAERPPAPPVAVAAPSVVSLSHTRNSRILDNSSLEDSGFDSRRMRQSLESKLREYRNLLHQPRTVYNFEEDLPTRRSYCF